MTLSATSPAATMAPRTLANDANAPKTAPTTEVASGLELLDKLTIVAIALVVVLVTIQKLRAFALRENELDAMRVLRVIAAEPAVPGTEDHRGDLAAMIARDKSLARRLGDLEFLPQGRIRRHGYLFDLTIEAPGRPVLRAWPWEHGRTGLGAFAWTPERGILGTVNQEGRFAGPDSPPELTSIDAGWVRMPRR